MNKKLYLILMIICLSSCSTYTHKPSQQEQTKPKYSVYIETNHSFFWGLQEKEFSNTKRKCEDNNKKIVKIESKSSFLNYVIRLYTLGIYWPRTLEIECK